MGSYLPDVETALLPGVYEPIEPVYRHHRHAAVDNDILLHKSDYKRYHAFRILPADQRTPFNLHFYRAPELGCLVPADRPPLALSGENVPGSFRQNVILPLDAGHD